jgi:hypothetical protein
VTFVGTTATGAVVIGQGEDVIIMQADEAEEVQRLLGGAVGEANRIGDQQPVDTGEIVDAAVERAADTTRSETQ